MTLVGKCWENCTLDSAAAPGGEKCSWGDADGNRKSSNQEEEADRKCCRDDVRRNRKQKKHIPSCSPGLACLPLGPCLGRA